MSFWIHGSSSDHQDFSDDLTAILANNSVSAAAINSGGTGYVVGDILSVAGGTALITAQIEVTSVSGGVIDGIRIYNAGSYSSDPTTTANAVTGGTGASATIDLTMSGLGWTVDRNQAMELSSASVSAGGTGYSVDDIITLAGGTYDTQAQLRVTSVSGGVITGVSVETAGFYDVLPSNPVAQASVSPAGGTGATFTLTWGGERQVIAHGEGGGSDAIYIGWRTLSNVGGDYYNWEVHGMTGYTSSLPLVEQPNVSPGDYTAGNPGDQGTYMILTSSSFNWWLNINSYRIIITANIGAAYFHAYLGWGNRLATSTEYPYPMLISCPSELHDVNAGRAEKMSSITDPWMGSSSSYTVHTVVYMPGGGWVPFWNRRSTAPYQDACVVPTQKPLVVTSGLPQDRFMYSSRQFGEIIYSLTNGTGGATTANLMSSGDNGDHLMLPCYYIVSVPTVALLLEVDECRWCNSFGGVSSEDRFIESDGTSWRVFQNGNRTDTYAYIAIKEAD